MSFFAGGGRFSRDGGFLPVAPAFLGGESFWGKKAFEDGNFGFSLAASSGRAAFFRIAQSHPAAFSFHFLSATMLTEFGHPGKVSVIAFDQQVSR